MFLLSHFSCVQLCWTLWTTAHQPPQSMEFSRQEYQSGLPWPPSGDLPDPGIEPASLMSPALAGWFLHSTVSVFKIPASELLGESFMQRVFSLLESDI